VKQIVALCI